MGLAARPWDAPPADTAMRARLAVPDASGPLERLAVDAMPDLLPRSLLEGFDDVERESRRRYGDAIDVVVGNYSVDEIQNEYLARCRAAGRRLVFSQHGGFYLQSPVNAHERLELERGGTFLSWGRRLDGAVPTPSPYLERLRGSHRGGTRITLVEWVEPPFSYVAGFAGGPLANQTFELAQMLADMVAALPPSRQAQLALKRFPTAIGTTSRPAALEALPADGPRGGAAAWMATSRLAVIPYIGTPFIESMVIGTPTVGLWNPARWPLLAELEPLFARLCKVGVVHHEPSSAAAHIDAVYDDTATWWTAPAVARVRAEFVQQFAIPGDGLNAWAARLGELRHSQ
jgi:putative transferase (TIGR04331 family)